jgi:transposase-like protein
MFPSTHSLNVIFTDEEACIEFLFANQILYSQPKCLKCRKKTYRSNKTWKCKDRACNWAISILKGSIFTSSKLSVNRIIYICYLWLAKCSNGSIELITGHSSATISTTIASIRMMINLNISENTEKIGGEGVIVEIDESKFGKRKYHRGHKVDGVWIVGGVERTNSRRFFAEPVTDRSSETLLEVIQRNIEPGSIIYSDMWRGYNNISSSLQMEHHTVNHSVNFVDPETLVHTNMIEGTWNGLKIGIPSRNYKKERVGNHISEFIWRRQNENDLWGAFLKVLSNTEFN